MNPALTVFVKECRESLRDRRVLLNSLLLGPLLGPLLFLVIMRLVVGRELEKAERPLPVVVINAERAPELIASLRQMGLEQKPPIADPELAVREQRIDLALRVSADYGADWRAGQPAQVELIYDSSRREANSDVDRLGGMLESYGHAAGARRAAVRNAPLYAGADHLHRRHLAGDRFDRGRARAPVARAAAHQSGAARPDPARQAPRHRDLQPGEPDTGTAGLPARRALHAHRAAGTEPRARAALLRRGAAAAAAAGAADLHRADPDRRLRPHGARGADLPGTRPAGAADPIDRAERTAGQGTAVDVRRAAARPATGDHAPAAGRAPVCHRTRPECRRDDARGRGGVRPDPPRLRLRAARDLDLKPQWAAPAPPPPPAGLAPAGGLTGGGQRQAGQP